MLSRLTRPMFRFCLIEAPVNIPKMNDYLDDARKFKAVVAKHPHFQPSLEGVYIYNKGELEFKSFLIMKSKENVEDYVLALVKNYFRSTYKSGVTVESDLSTHGLDSIDAMELAMQIEEDLGYTIPSETLANFHRVKHYINYILQVEAFKFDYNKRPLA